MQASKFHKSRIVQRASSYRNKDKLKKISNKMHLMISSAPNLIGGHRVSQRDTFPDAGNG